MAYKQKKRMIVETNIHIKTFTNAHIYRLVVKFIIHFEALDDPDC